MQSRQAAQTSSSPDKPAQDLSWTQQQPTQASNSGTGTDFSSTTNFYQQQLHQQLQHHLQQQLLSRAGGSQLQLPTYLSTPEQRLQALLQQHQQPPAQQAGFALESLVHALGSRLPAQAASPFPATSQQQQQLQLQHAVPSQAPSRQPEPAQSTAAVPAQQPDSKLQPKQSEQPVVRRFSGPASSSFQPHALTSRASLQPTSQAASVPPAQAQHAAQPINSTKPSATSGALAAPVHAQVRASSGSTATAQPPQPTLAQAAPFTGPLAPAVARQPAQPEAPSAADGLDESPQVLKPPPPGKVVWAKLARYPWWPAEVLDMSDSYIPEGEEPPRLGAVPVRFFGTYAFSWIESKRAIEPFDEEHMEHAANSRQPEFQRGVTEAKHFQLTGELPHGFTVALQEFYAEQQKAKTKAAAKGGKTADDQKDLNGKGGKKAGGKRQHDDPVAAEHARHRAIIARRLRLLRHLGLVPPAGSPFATANAASLDGFGPIAAQLGWVSKPSQ